MPTLTSHHHELQPADLTIRHAVFQHFIQSGQAPASAQLAAEFKLSPEEVQAAFLRLAQNHMLVLRSDSPEILMAHPFSAVPTDYPVSSGDLTWWANCIWDALGIPAMLGKDADIHTTCPDCNQPIFLSIKDGRLTGDSGLIHFGVPAKQWWDNITFT